MYVYYEFMTVKYWLLHSIDYEIPLRFSQQQQQESMCLWNLWSKKNIALVNYSFIISSFKDK